jgi:hypothetical protein
MAINRSKRFSKKAQSSVFGAAIAAGIEDPKNLQNAIEFIEGPNGIGIVLRPVQRVIVKAIYGLAFDWRPAWADRIEGWGKVPMYDVFREKKLYPDVTEEEYLRIVTNEGRCNVNDWREIPGMGGMPGEAGFNEACIFAGRRGGKSELVAAIAAYKLYLLLNIKCPQEHFGLFPGSIIDFTFLAQDENGAHRLFKKLREQVLKAESFFGTYLKDTNAKDLSFVTLSDREKGNITPTVTVSCLPCTTNAVRSPSSIFLALDEFAHFRSAKGSTSDDMYAAASPATADFHHDKKLEEGTEDKVFNELLEQNQIEYGTSFGEEPSVQAEESEDGSEAIGIQDSMILSISSPLKKIGKMYELHKLALEEGCKGDSPIFTLNCPSAEMNPKLLPKFFRSEYKKNPLTFKCEYQGKFLESSESYVTEEAVKRCTDVQWDEKGLPVQGTIRSNVMSFRPEAIGRQYFWGFDLGMSNDASALAIGHLEPGGPHGTIKLVYDYIDRMMVGETGEWPGVKAPMPGQAPKYTGYQVLPLEDILDWLDAMNKCLPCFKGATDQHGGQQLVQLLGLKQIMNVELVNLTPAINSQMAYALRGYIESERCSFPLVPKFIQELKLVELEVASKYQIRVAAPQEKGAHDDMADAAMLVAFLAQRWLMEQGNMMDPSGLSLMIQAQANKPAGTLLSLDGVSMQTLKVLEKLKSTEKHSNMYAGTSPVSPWHRRGRR